MYISPVTQYNFNTNRTQRINLNNRQTPAFTSLSAGKLGRTTTEAFDGVMSAYNDIVSKLALKTSEGIELLQKDYPDITIGEGLVFHNCGDDKVSIAIKKAESAEYKGLTKIIVRKGNSTWSERITLDSFLFKDNDRLVKNFDKTHIKQFPKDIEFESQQVIDGQNYEKRLETVLEKLDFAMLKFRKYLSKNMDTHIKLPDGIIPYKTGIKLEKVDKLNEEINSVRNSYSSKSRFKMTEGFNDYVPVTGTKSFVFKCDDGKLISYSRVESSKYKDLKRVVVYDENKTPLRCFNIVDNKKIIANTNDNYPAYLPDNPVFADEKQMLEQKFIPDLDKSLDLYYEKLSLFKHRIDNFVKSRESVNGVLSDENINDLSVITELYNSINAKLKSVSDVKASNIRTMYENIEASAGKRGFTFVNFDGGKKVSITPLKSKDSGSLVKLVIQNDDNSESQTFLIKDFKNVVKNYNPDYPQIIPRVLKFYNDFELENININPCLKFLKEELAKFDGFVSEEIKPKPRPVKPVVSKIIKQPKSVKTQQTKTENQSIDIKKSPRYKDLIKECNAELTMAMNNINGGLDEFNMTLSKIQQKVAAFFEQNK